MQFTINIMNTEWSLRSEPRNLLKSQFKSSMLMCNLCHLCAIHFLNAKNFYLIVDNQSINWQNRGSRNLKAVTHSITNFDFVKFIKLNIKNIDQCTNSETA
jgi:hypothetical protein